MDPRRLEELSLNSSAPPGQLLYDGWLLRFSPGKAKRARSINAFYPSSLPIAEKIAHRERVYGMRGLPAIYRLSMLTDPPQLDATLADRGYESFSPTEVRAAVIEPEWLAGPDVETLRLEEWFDMVGELRDSPIAHRSAHVSRLAALPLAKHCVAVQEAGETMATGLAIVEDRHVGLFDVVTREGQRRRGFARTIVAALLRWGWEQGARQSYLQVEEGNDAAVELYRGFGFAAVYRYWYRGRPGETQ